MNMSVRSLDYFAVFITDSATWKLLKIGENQLLSNNSLKQRS